MSAKCTTDITALEWSLVSPQRYDHVRVVVRYDVGSDRTIMRIEGFKDAAARHYDIDISKAIDELRKAM